jgi:hypothetical protein
MHGSISSWTTVDLSFAYGTARGGNSLFSNMRMGFDVANVFNRAPPLVGGGGATVYRFDPTNANGLLRNFGVTITKGFGGNPNRS